MNKPVNKLKIITTSRRVMLSAVSIALVFGVLNMQNDKVFALTDNERYNQGYSWGCSDARTGGHPYLKSHPTHTRIFMNGYNGGYSACSESARENWLGTCKAVEWGLLHSCNTYVAPSGSLTLAGNRAYDCISGGGLLTGVGLLVNIPPAGIIQILQHASKLFDCDGIVNWTQLDIASNALSFLKILDIR